MGLLFFNAILVCAIAANAIMIIEVTNTYTSELYWISVLAGSVTAIEVVRRGRKAYGLRKDVTSRITGVFGVFQSLFVAPLLIGAIDVLSDQVDFRSMAIVYWGLPAMPLLCTPIAALSFVDWKSRKDSQAIMNMRNLAKRRSESNGQA